MKLVIVLWLILAAIELAMYVPPLWARRRPLSIFLVLSQLISLIGLVIMQLNLANILVSLIGLYRLVNLTRVFLERIELKYLLSISRRSSLSLIGLQAVGAGLAAVSNQLNFSPALWLYLIVSCQLAAAVILLGTLFRNVKQTEPIRAGLKTNTKDLVSVSVCIPARNETDELATCLNSLVQSNYPKLEIIVLDDCSQTRRTPDIIRQFASRGVRFIGGKLPPKTWLAKNYAYSQLAEAASGDIVVFCGVDSRFSESTVSEIAAEISAHKLNMLSLMPINILPQLKLKRLLIQPVRYLWELALPRLLLNRPPILSTCWAVKRQFLVKNGNFKTVAHKVRPESYFARIAASTSSYRFLRSADRFGLTSQKSFNDQEDTAIRTRYPQTHRRLEIVCLLTLAELVVLIGPLLLIILGAIYSLWLVSLVALLAVVIELAVYQIGVYLCYGRWLTLGLISLPLAAFYDVVILNQSMYLYEFKEVIWKGRNICLPVMRLQPHLDSAPPH